jgi:hypothetical protein
MADQINMLNDYNWNKFMLRINLNDSTDRIYEAWTNTEVLEQWMLLKARITKNEDDAEKTVMQKEDLYEWYWSSDAKQVQKGSILEANGKDLFQFSFSGDSIVTVMISEERGENVLELWQENIPDNRIGRINYHLNCLKSWTFYLTNLKSFLENKVDLRNKNPELENLLNG